MKFWTIFSIIAVCLGLQSMAAQTVLVPQRLTEEPAASPLIARPNPFAAVPDDPRDRHVKAVWATSIAAMLAGTTLDAVSSWHKTEGNALLASSNGVFGGRGIVIKAGIAGGVLLPQIILRKRKDLRIAFSIGNFTEASVFGGVAIHNFRVGPPRS